jgi:hypothetical protein
MFEYLLSSSDLSTVGFIHELRNLISIFLDQAIQICFQISGRWNQPKGIKAMDLIQLFFSEIICLRIISSVQNQRMTRALKISF